MSGMSIHAWKMRVWHNDSNTKHFDKQSSESSNDVLNIQGEGQVGVVALEGGTMISLRV